MADGGHFGFGLYRNLWPSGRQAPWWFFMFRHLLTKWKWESPLTPFCKRVCKRGTGLKRSCSSRAYQWTVAFQRIGRDLEVAHAYQYQQLGKKGRTIYRCAKNCWFIAFFSFVVFFRVDVFHHQATSSIQRRAKAITVTLPNLSWHFLRVLTSSQALSHHWHSAPLCRQFFSASWQRVIVDFFCVNSNNRPRPMLIQDVASFVALPSDRRSNIPVSDTCERWVNVVWQTTNNVASWH